MINAKELYEFFRDGERMCMSLSGCRECKMNSINCAINELSTEKELETIINTVNERKNKKPPKTKQSEFLKQYPNVRLDINSMIDIAPCVIDFNFNSECVGDCMECRQKYWQKEIE